MEEFFKIVITGIMDAIEEFFNALTVPTRRYTLDALIVSGVFLLWSIVAQVFNIVSFVDWRESLTCSILLGIVVLIDSSTKSAIMSSLSKIKDIASKFSYTGEDIETEEEVNEDEPGEQ